VTTPAADHAAQGDREALGRLYSRYAGQVFGVVLSRVGDPRLAEDLTAETFVRALRAAQSNGVSVTNPRAWLDTIACNLVRDHYRSSRSRREIPTSEFSDRATRDTGPEQAVITTETVGELGRAAQGLTPDQRECLRLRFVEQLSVADTAAVLGCPVGTVKTRQHRALHALRTAMTAACPPIPPRQRVGVDPLAAARRAVAQVHQHVTTTDHHTPTSAPEQHWARWQAPDQTNALDQATTTTPDTMPVLVAGGRA
jgi:RNA polymerase sigma-70 factor (ECF subfamily)